VVTSDKDGENCTVDREIVDAHYIISQPFWPAYVTAERMAKAKNLKACITAGIGSDHVDLAAAAERKIDVSEVTFCNSISVSEHVVMQILSLVRTTFHRTCGPRNHLGGISQTVFSEPTTLKV
jgi:formate dehydrogenase